MAGKKRKISKELEAFLNEHSELNDAYLNLRDTPTSKQVFYAIALGIELNGQTFKEISSFIDQALKQTREKNGYDVPFDLRDEVYELMLENSNDKPISNDDWQACLEENHLIFPPGTTYAQMEKTVDQFDARMRLAKCPYCKEVLYNGEAELVTENRCSSCHHTLHGLGIKVDFNEKGRPVFGKELTRVLPFQNGNSQRNSSKKGDSKGCLVVVLIIVIVYCLWHLIA